MKLKITTVPVEKSRIVKFGNEPRIEHLEKGMSYKTDFVKPVALLLVSDEEPKDGDNVFDTYSGLVQTFTIGVNDGNAADFLKKIIGSHSHPELPNTISDSDLPYLLDLGEVEIEMVNGIDESNKETRKPFIFNGCVKVVKPKDDDEFKVGDKVFCLYGDSGHKSWSDYLKPFVVISEIKKHNGKPNELKFETVDSWFYENDFDIFTGAFLQSDLNKRKTYLDPNPKKQIPETKLDLAESFMKKYLGGNMNTASLTPFAIQEMMVAFSKEKKFTIEDVKALKQALENALDKFEQLEAYGVYEGYRLGDNVSEIQDVLSNDKYKEQ